MRQGVAMVGASRPSSARPRVFLSYAHDDDRHRNLVSAFAAFLTRSGVDVDFDMWLTGERQDWYAWALDRVTTADFVIVVASPRYRAVGDGTAPGEKNRGVQAEAAVLREMLYADRARWLPRILPVVLPGRALGELPTFVQAHSASHFAVREMTDAGFEELLRVITGQPRHVRPPIGAVPALPPDEPVALTWNPLPFPPEVPWFGDLHVGGPEHAALEVHLVPLDGAARISARHLANAPDALTDHGMRTGLFSTGDSVRTYGSAATVLAWTRCAGLAMRRDGARSAWELLPFADVGAVFDAESVCDQVIRLLGNLNGVDAVLPDEVVPAVGLESVGVLRMGSTAPWRFDLPERVRPLADEVIDSHWVLADPRSVANELASRLTAALRAW
ncbi:SEFIR domain-containing protein [Lentzea cavernae]|nr:SEFIR domain-containing protein [Lentzea cavernae]